MDNKKNKDSRPLRSGASCRISPASPIALLDHDCTHLERSDEDTRCGPRLEPFFLEQSSSSDDHWVRRMARHEIILERRANLVEPCACLEGTSCFSSPHGLDNFLLETINTVLAICAEEDDPVERGAHK